MSPRSLGSRPRMPDPRGARGGKGSTDPVPPLPLPTKAAPARISSQRTQSGAEPCSLVPLEPRESPHFPAVPTESPVVHDFPFYPCMTQSSTDERFGCCVPAQMDVDAAEIPVGKRARGSAATTDEPIFLCDMGLWVGARGFKARKQCDICWRKVDFLPKSSFTAKKNPNLPFLWLVSPTWVPALPGNCSSSPKLSPNKGCEYCPACCPARAFCGDAYGGGKQREIKHSSKFSPC